MTTKHGILSPYSRKIAGTLLVQLVYLASATLCWGEIKLPHLFTEHMVLQQRRPVAVWGSATPGSAVKVAIGDQVQEGKAGEDGKWRVVFPARSQGGPLEFRVTSDKDTAAIEFKDVWYGEVWVCSGQSNMEWNVESSTRAAEEIAEADLPQIRLFQVPHVPSDVPLADCEASWGLCTPESVKAFSAVAYSFGRKVADETGLTVGLIGSHWGGTRGEVWVSQDALRDRPFYRPLLDYKAPADQPFTAASSLYNGMIAPLTNYAIRGALWYQGESNIGRSEQYGRLFPTLIQDWRNQWRQGDFPFYFVQLAPYRYQGADPSIYAELCEAQLRTLSLPNTGMVVTNDIGDLADIHPKDKKTVGERLGLWAMAHDYGKTDLAFSGPLYSGVEIVGAEAHVKFRYVFGGLKTRDEKAPTEFMIAGRDRKFVPAEARIEHDMVVVSSPQVAEPVAVRFAWSDSAQPNLMNGKGLPASAFRTDDFRLLSEGNWNP